MEYFEVVKQRREDLAEELAALCEHPRVALPSELVEVAHGHRPRYGSSIFPLDCMVATPVSKRIREDKTGKAVQAMKKEWDNLRRKGVWDDLEVR